ncbi:MAG: peptidylprolyl isomerase [Thermoplasmata archaeon]|jgi:FKBP-type peptidyl-prolyl cis-trans isomerase 2|nr:peptidylprolyl isomerase [Thermoplasmata archaeon]
MADAKKLIRLSYKAYLADADERLYDTTDAEAAKEAGIFNEKVKYEPMVYLCGNKTLFPDLEAAIESAEIGKETTVTIPCEKAAGARNPKLIELHPIKEFYKQEINPYPGMTVTLGKRTGVIMSVAAGRVKVDFNNQLAGHDLKYIFTVTEEITEDKAKALAIIELNLGTSEGFDAAIEADKVVITEAEICKFNQDWPIAKYKIVSDLRAAFGVDRIDFVQVWEVAKKE